MWRLNRLSDLRDFLGEERRVGDFFVLDEGDGVGAFAGDETGVRRMSAYDRLVAELSMSTVGESGVSSMAGG